MFHHSNFRISRMYRYATLHEAHVKRLACSEKRTEIHQPLAQRRMLGLFPTGSLSIEQSGNSGEALEAGAPYRARSGIVTRSSARTAPRDYLNAFSGIADTGNHR